MRAEAITPHATTGLPATSGVFRGGDRPLILGMIHTVTPGVRRAAALATLLLGVSALTAWRAPFHLHLVKSAPAANASVAAAPDSIRLWFSQPPELKLTTVKVTGPGSATIALAPLTKGDSALVVAAVKGRMAVGAYTVVWRTMSKDGHVVRGTFAFKVGASATD
jgi:methionine-rich copper-binding protein CopC